MDMSIHKELSIPVDKVNLGGELYIPHKAKAIVVFSHGSGSSRFSKRNQQVAGYLRENHFGTLLLDLLTPEEDSLYANRFNIDLLTKRLAGATQWLISLPDAKNCRIGYFGASTGAASALQAAAMFSEAGAVVSRGGRPDLASSDALRKVKAPVLLLVGSLDTDVLLLNKQAFGELRCEKKLVIVEGATHLFEEQGKLDEVARLASAWFKKYLDPSS
jgi:putative phosphoribosyl transferase